MSSTPRFAHCNTRKPDGFYVQFERILEDDDTTDAPDERCDGYWPSQDKDDAGYCGDVSAERFAELHHEAQARMDAWRRGDWNYVGVRARAKCLVVCSSVGTYINIDSAGLWGIESDSGAYLDEVYANEIAELKLLIEAMHNPTYETE